MNPRPALRPFTEEIARRKVQAVEDAWDARDPERVALAYTKDTEWRNRKNFYVAAPKSSNSSGANGIVNWTIA